MSTNRKKTRQREPTQKRRRLPNVRISADLYGWLQRNLLFTLFLVGIGLAYIYTANYAEKQARRAETLKDELKELKSEYMTLNARLSVRRKQSQVARVVDSLGLEPLRHPPYKLIIQDEDETSSP